MESNTKGCMNCGNISCPNNKKRVSAGCGRWKTPEQKIIELEEENSELREKNEGFQRACLRMKDMGFPTFASVKEYAAKLQELEKALKIMRDIGACELMKVITKAKQYEALDNLENFLREIPEGSEC